MHAEAVIETPQLNVGQIDSLESEYRKLKEQISDSKKTLEKLETRSKEIEQRRSQAQRLLDLSANIGGFTREREEAVAVLAECGDRKARLQDSLDAQKGWLRQYEEAIKRIDPALFEKPAEIRSLALALKNSAPPIGGYGSSE